jgi:hypothetical protein
MNAPTFDPKTILAASAPWLAAVLNVVPGLGTGYIYQRRWRAYWATALGASLWIGLTSPFALPWRVEGEGPDLTLPGLLGLAAVSAMEAFLAGRRARMN